MQDLLNRQSELIKSIEKIFTNFHKDGPSRKTEDYIEKRLEALDNLWGEFEQNHKTLVTFGDESSEYFSKKVYGKMVEYYQTERTFISSYKIERPAEQRSQAKQEGGHTSDTAIPACIKHQFEVPVSHAEVRGINLAEDVLSQQRTNFRALLRIIRRIDLNNMEEKWEIEDHLRDLQYRWRIIDELHLRIDNMLQGQDLHYEAEFDKYEEKYNSIRKQLNRKLCSSTHLQQSTPKVEIPTFVGRYAQWPTFFDMFNETIHNNNSLSKSQKMQHLKSKVKGEAERLIQHLPISSENYDSAWEILTHRYNNPFALFTNQLETFLNQPIIHKQTSFELKRLHDTTMECVHAIHNLGVDTTTWDPILVHLITKKLDMETYKDYKEARKSPRDLPSLDELMNIIESKFTALEPLNKRDKQGNYSSPTNKQAPKPISFYNQKLQTYQSVPTSTSRCPICHAAHDLYRCKQFINMAPEDKIKAIRKQQICQNCLYRHYNKPCVSQRRCRTCDGKHNSLIHDDIMQIEASAKRGSSTALPGCSTDRVKSPSDKPHNVNHVAAEDEEILLTTLLLKVKAANDTYITLRALLDQGSQISLISERAAQILGLKRQKYQASVSGIGVSSKSSKGMITMECESIYGDYQFTTQALIISRVINNLPNASFNKRSWSHIQNIKLADPEYNISKPIDLLLDASIYSAIIMSGLIKGPSQSPIAQQTKLGWILSGSVKTFNCNVVVNKLDDLSKFWEVEDINLPSASMTEQEEYCEQFYQKTTRRLDNGRYEVALPMKPNYEEKLGTSRSKAIMQFKQLEKRMSKNEQLSEAYKKFIHEYESLQHMRSADPMTSTPSNYLPHHGVMKLDSTTTALRVVFNASAKTSSGYSLNDLMECGPNLQQDLQGLILKWRMHRYVITADIEKMFRQFLIRESDQYLQTIIWRDSPEDLLCEYHLTTITYGTKAAPFLAMRTLKQIGRDNSTDYPLAAQALENCFYTDDLMTGHDSIEHAKELQAQLIEVLRGAGLNLRKWSSNSSALIQDLLSEQLNTPLEFKDMESRKTLGLQWNPISDTFTFQNKINYQEDQGRHTKRHLLSDISKIYDPLGWLSPITIKAKMLFQRTWSTDMKWDDELPSDILTDWQRLREDLRNIEGFSIPRYLGDKTSYQIHGFCDASEKAYACAVYVVTKNAKGEYTSRLIAAKTKVAPQGKIISLPRLELLGAHLLSQLMVKIVEAISTDHHTITINAWTDSMVVLGWLHGDITRWKQFVANRVRQITDILPASQWRHVKSADNAADCATRGLTSEHLREKLWWEGPQWLTTSNPSDMTSDKIECPTIEIKERRVNAALHRDTIITKLINNCSSFTYVTRVVAWALRFITRLRKQKSTEQGANTKTLSLAEIHGAQNIIIKHTQSLEFNDEINHIRKKGYVRSSSKISNLNPFLDKHDILRVGGRLQNSNLNYSAKHPVLLPSGSRLTELIINQAHILTLHGGPRLTLSHIRDRYWIISGIRTVKKQIRLCVKCRRYSQETQQQIMADLPTPRITPSRPFTNTGVDFTGHVDIKANKGRGVKTTKGYIAVFVCLATKAVHLELVSDLTTTAFLAAFRRMSSRRGTPQHMYSDNGTNFVGAARVLKQEYKAIVQTMDDNFIKKINDMGVTWHFNAPRWASAGGLWEASVKSMKYHLKRVLGDQRLTYEEFITLLYQIEACMNSRPLCPLTESLEDDFLTPGHFLVGGSLLSRPQTDPDNINLPARWQLVQQLNKQFWKKWSSEYLQQLQTRSKWRTPRKNIEINDIAIIQEDNLPPGKWALGRVQELHPGKDGYVRVVSLKTQNNIIKRPITKLVTLPINDVLERQVTPIRDDTQATQSHEDSTKRERRRPKRCTYTHFISMAALLTMTLILSPGAQSTVPYNFTALSDHQGLYFDKTSELQHIRDEWKLIIYYNMSTYWHGLSDIKEYITHLKGMCTTQDGQYDGIILQLQHDASEINHLNNLLTNQHLRRKRGLVNGVGYIANSLFGVLDERFAEQYKDDIEKVAQNENHLQNLIKNQTLVIESEYNIMRRNEDIMNQQLLFIKQHLQNLSLEVGQVRLVNNHAMYIMSSALTAYTHLSNLRRIQQTLIDTVTDISHGHIDARLLPPEQLEEQVNIIQGQLYGELTLPTDKDNLRQLYRLLRVSARVLKDYLIIEVRIPLVSNEMYELDRVITVPLKKGEYMQHIIPTFPFIAFNLKKDMVIFVSHNDLQSCMRTQTNRYLCNLDKPVYDMKIKNSICNIKLINTETINSTPCTKQLSTCDADRWIRLHQQNSWLYSCCRECKLRIFCRTDMEIKSVTGNGILTLGHGCTIKGDTYTAYAHNNFFNHVKQQPDVIAIPETSVLNTVINTSISSFDDLPLPVEPRQEVWDRLKTQIEQLKENSSQQMNIHDIHHYTLLYVILGGLTLVSGVILILWRRWRRTVLKQPRLAINTPPVPCPRASSATDVQQPPSTPITTRLNFDVPTPSTMN